MTFVLLLCLMHMPTVPDFQLVAAIGQHESEGNNNAIGDKDCYGYLQVRQVCLDDVNHHYGTNYKVADILGNRNLSIWVFQKYMETYATKKRLGRTPTQEDKARIWNGGPNGFKEKTTKPYWAKVKKHMSPK